MFGFGKKNPCPAKDACPIANAGDGTCTRMDDYHNCSTYKMVMGE